MGLLGRILLCLLLCTASAYGTSQQEKEDRLLSDIRAIIFDMDGVLRRGFDQIPGAGDLISWMKQNRMAAVILTNECRYTESRLRTDLKNMGIPYPDDWPIYSAAMAARDFVQDKIPARGKLYAHAIGEKGLQEALNQVSRPNFQVCAEPPGQLGEEDELLLVFGSVNRVQIDDLEQAMAWIRAGANVLATCPDSADPAVKGSRIIGMPYHMVHMIRMQAPCNPYNVGKPHPFVIRACMKRLLETDPTISPEEVLFVGDSMDTDVQLAFETGLRSALVLTGNTRKEMVGNFVIKPDLVFASVKELHEALQRQGTL